MAIPLEVRQGFVEGFIKDEYDRPFELLDWQRENIFEPLDGYKLWRRGWTPDGAVDPTPICADCAELVGTIVPDGDGVPKHGKCPGLDAHKIIITVDNVKRQQGKSAGAGAYGLSETFLARNASTLYMAASKDQARRVFEAKFATPVRRNPELARRSVIGLDSIKNDAKGAYFKFIPASAKSAPSGTIRLLIIDEARDVKAETAAALIPSILGAYGVECPTGHYTAGADKAPAGSECPLCGAELEKWFGRVLIMSSSGDAAGWFAELVEFLEANPQPIAHVFRSSETLNKHFNEQGADALEAVFGGLPSMGVYMRRELHNEFTREGDEFLPLAAISAITNDKLTNEETIDRPVVGFLDASRTRELTSLVLGADFSGDHEPPFERVVCVRIDVWDPKKLPKGRVDEQAVKAFLRDEIVPYFPSLLEIGVDTNLAPWAQELVEDARDEGWGRMLVGYKADSMFNFLIWSALERRAMAGRSFLQIPNHPRLIKELKKATIRREPGGRIKVLDSAQGDRRGSVHRDVSMSLAGMVWIADKFRARGLGGEASAAVERINRSVRLAGMRPVTSGVDRMEF